MKKILILTLSVITFSFGYAQDDLDDDLDLNTEEYKQSSGSKSLEFQFDPGAVFNASNTNNVISNGMGVRFRLFPSQNIAYRLNLNINYNNINTLIQEADDATGDLELRDKTSDIGIYINPGFESHFGGTKRLSPYIGAELIVGYQTSIDKSEAQAGTEVYTTTTKNANTGDGFTLGAAGVAGADFYIAKKLYMGVEMSYGVSYFMPSKTKISSDAPGTTDIETKVGKSNVINFSPQALGVFRIGFLF